MGKSGIIIALALGALIVFVVFLPSLRQWWLEIRADDVTISYPIGSQAGLGTLGSTETRDLKIVSVLGRDGIRAILEPEFISATEAFSQMASDERVLGLSINGDQRAYPLCKRSAIMGHF